MYRVLFSEEAMALSKRPLEKLHLAVAQILKLRKSLFQIVPELVIKNMWEYRLIHTFDLRFSKIGSFYYVLTCSLGSGS